MFRYILFFLFFIPVKALGQNSNKSCKPTSSVKAFVCPSFPDSLSPCRPCYHCRFHLQASDSNYRITSYKILLKDLCDDEKSAEITVTDNVLSPYAKLMITKVCSGSTVFFECIIAKDKYNNSLILQPFMKKCPEISIYK